MQGNPIALVIGLRHIQFTHLVDIVNPAICLHIFGCVCVAIAVFADSDLSDAWIEDSSIALAYMDLMAADQGVGSCWVQMRMRKDEAGGDAEQNVRDILDVELPWRIVGIMALGMPAEEKEPYSLDELMWEKVQRR